jgi:hypothetical protein
VPIENPTALAQAIMRVAESEQLRAKFGAAARRLVVGKLSARIIGRSVVELYDHLTPETPEKDIRKAGYRS